MAKLSITIKIAGGTYPFTVDSADEEVYRLAEREVNRLAAEGSNTTLLPKDRLALAALALAMDNIRLKSSRDLGPQGERLADVERMIDEYLGSL